MNHYAFYEEFDGHASRPVLLGRPGFTLPAETMLTAIRQFADRNKLRLTHFDELDEGSMRAFYSRKKLFHHAQEVIYYVCAADDADSDAKSGSSPSE
ncbi:hypothetical protein [Sporolactobacillus vineae]|uniref:hypothetical protein n=1 Tax=Sporolactobacillus vineae TaxID=444463 RepID=UPI000288FB5D|nr:hypothetical protein [Sporolactobacillus vineae]